MGVLIGAGVISLFAVALLIVGNALQNQGVIFEKNKRVGIAEVVGYDSGEQSNCYTLMVKIPELNNGKLYSCASGKIELSDYPKGKLIDVIYAPMKLMGVSTIEVHLLSNPPVNNINFGKEINKFSKLLFVISLVLLVVGIISFFV